MLAAREKEKRRIARELHDDLGQRLVLKTDMAMLGADVQGGKPSACLLDDSDRDRRHRFAPASASGPPEPGYCNGSAPSGSRCQAAGPANRRGRVTP
ncbi:histidine kinase [Cupriavidus necator]